MIAAVNLAMLALAAGLVLLPPLILAGSYVIVFRKAGFPEIAWLAGALPVLAFLWAWLQASGTHRAMAGAVGNIDIWSMLAQAWTDPQTAAQHLMWFLPNLAWSMVTPAILYSPVIVLAFLRWRRPAAQNG